ncbi:uncharacterized protein Nmag_2553 [Natrialba magadii ATCC 43099]|uniref:Uncharacterized protein n=1 Tax=Natrialba magadii (strain ATCC 43099 / DSM 3394 / CCM 3739 / CIP 104546 / IAM 13178 / JCM 8861 / NBRC 102185 / NCIMB 2190 / MS3) TaxID=547559 RepID=D3SYE2_NATMM|nr:hypothetical protein [Natrialba magadii]ADD06113.1 uncharacterized protein Nmag_2553 [Natrialba magadii ATCC 43099]ELY30890.1 hypothetical protein C500_07628 [Natrialba magadii ATCC 43099]
MTAHTPSDHGRDQNRDDDESSGYEYGTDGAVSPDVGSKPGTLPLVGGGILVLSAARALLRGQLRSIPIGAAGVGLLKYGLSKRQEGASEQTDLESFADESDPGDNSAASSPIEFVTDDSEPRSKPSLDGESGDPRRAEAEDGEVEIDVSESATMSEASEATGPDPTQAEPAQTEGTEPEATPREDLADERAGDAGEDEDDSEAESETEDDDNAGSESESESESEDGDENDPEDENDESHAR